MAAKVIALANQKGGVGKTTSTVNIARALHEKGQRVLAIDCDPQSSLSIVCGIDDRRLRDLEQAGRTLYHGLVKQTPLADDIAIRAALFLARSNSSITWLGGMSKSSISRRVRIVSRSTGRSVDASSAPVLFSSKYRAPESAVAAM